MLGILNIFVDICLLRRGPQHVPASSTLLVIMLALNIISGILAMSVDTTIGQALLIALVDILFSVALLHIALTIRGHRERMLQTLTAVLGTGMLFSLLSWPVSAWYQAALESDADRGLPAVVLFLLLIWNIVVIGHILRHALDVTPAVGVGLSLLYVFLTIYLISTLFAI